ncbi:MAG: DUF262 domain-containing protein [Bacteroidetes bacterium]|nr:MAG: DUF262 domain-containing protein [Bacteroidota bacterium]
MESKISVKPDKIRLLNLLENVGNGEIQIPIFQRDFVWETKQIMDLFDSIAKDYPMGSFLFWRPEQKYPVKKNIGIYEVEAHPTRTLYILDGSQRITTLFAVLANPQKYVLNEKENKTSKFSIYYNLKTKEFVSISKQKDEEYYLMPLYKIVDTYLFLDFLREIENQNLEKSETRILIDNAKAITKILYDYEIPYTEIRGGDIKSAVEIFSRVNSTGMDISPDFMLSALAYNNETEFLLTNEIDIFLTKLQTYNFEKLKRDTILYCICNAKDKVYFDVEIESLSEFNLEELSKNTFIQIKKAVEFLYERIFMINIGFLPYPTQFIFIANFFRLNPNPTEEKLKDLEKWFWITTYSNYFTIYSPSQQRSAYRLFVNFINDEHEHGLLETTKLTVLDFPEKLNFTGVRPKALQLFFLNNICKGAELETQESIKEFFIFNKKDKTPSNMIFRLSSEFESDKNKREIKDFILTLEEEQLSKYFLTKELQTLYKQIENETEKDVDKINEFLEKRGIIIQQQEQEFIDNFSYFEKT